MKYTFGDSIPAVLRLELLNEVFSSSSRGFVTRAVANRPRLALDLGCGPGYSTHLLADALSPDLTVGLDNSQPFISLAKSSATKTTAFQLHDITHLPFPFQAADIVYCRFLLTHLEGPEAIIGRWASQLAPGGLLLFDETEWIHAHNPVFARYEEIVSGMIASQGGRLCIGPMLEELTGNSIVKRRSEVVQVTATTCLAARMFSLNIESWKHQSYIVTHFTSDEIERLRDAMRVLADNDQGEGEIEWGMRQIVFQRV